MIERLSLYWELFADSFISGVCAAWVLAQIGVLLLARGQVFLGAAVSQASTLGIALALALAAWFEEEAWTKIPGFATAAALLFSVGAAILSTRAIAREREETVTGWVFLAAGSLAILVVTDIPHGAEEIHNLLFSSIVVATRGDSWTFAILAIATSVVFLRYRAVLLLHAIDPAMASAVGVRSSLLGVATATWVGLVVGLALRSSGLLFTFGSLLLPPLLARTMTREVRSLLVAAPVLAAVMTALSFVAADGLGYPPGQLTVAVLALLVGGAWSVIALLRR